MKRYFYFMLVLFGSLSLMSLDPKNPPTGNSSAPGEISCGSCHSGGAYTATPTLMGVPNPVVPGQTYTVTLGVTSNAVKNGFQLTCLDGNNSNCGSFSVPGAGVNLTAANGRNYARQSTPSAANASWTFKWTAPASLTNNAINFYYSTANCNGNGKDTGDKVTNGSFSTVLSSPVTPVSATVSKADVVCNGGNNGSATVTASGGQMPYAYKWSNGQTSQTATRAVKF